MKYEIILNDEQRRLVEANLHLVQKIIRCGIHVNESVCGLGYDDLYQEGCICLCRAAATYNENRSQFPTYARKVIQNGLLSYCRSVCSTEKYTANLRVGDNGELIALGSIVALPDSVSQRISTIEALDLLFSQRQCYRGVTKRGIEALAMKIQGMGVTEIAEVYRVPPSYVGAWISRAVSRLRKDKEFLTELSES